VLSQCPSAGALLCQRWTSDAFRRIAERRTWSWLVKYNQFILPVVYNTGTVTVTQNSATVIGSGTTWDPSMVGRQFRVSVSTPIYTISLVNSATSLQLELPYGGQTTAGIGYQIYQAYVTPPNDFRSFISLWDPNYSWQLRLNTQQQELNSWDAQRANTGQAYVVASLDYTTNAVGTIRNPVQVIGSGAAPLIAGSANYTGAANSIFTVIITSGGASGTAVFEWEKDAGGFTTGVLTDPGALDLSDGVQIFFPAGTYVVGDTFVIQAFVVNTVGVPRFELWPHNLSNYVYPYLYEAVCQDIDELGAVIPRYIHQDVLLDMALAMAARWPGPSVDAPNPYYDLNLSDRIERKCEMMIGELEKVDDNTYESMVGYAQNMEFAPWFDSRFLQNHGI